jgi:hypothetical protein
MNKVSTKVIAKESVEEESHDEDGRCGLLENYPAQQVCYR